MKYGLAIQYLVHELKRDYIIFEPLARFLVSQNRNKEICPSFHFPNHNLRRGTYNRQKVVKFHGRIQCHSM